MYAQFWLGKIKKKIALGGIGRRLEINIIVELNHLNAVLNPISHLLSLLGSHLILHVSRIRFKKVGGILWTGVTCSRI